MKIFSAAQIRELDRLTIEREPISSIDLMERAAVRWTDWFVGLYSDTERKVVVCCGPGNNGGDGYAIARLLTQRGYPVFVFATDAKSADARKNRDRWEQLRGSKTRTLDLCAIPASAIVVDALLGSGLDRPVETGDIAHAVETINASGAEVVSVDIPSGLFADQHTASLHVTAGRTGTFQSPKLSFFLDEAPGDWSVIDIGLDRSALEQTEVLYQYQIGSELGEHLQLRGRFDHKGTFGHALVVGGSYGKIGAALLCGRATLRAGAGLLTLQVPQCGYQIVQSSFPEAMTLTDRHQTCLSEIPDLENYRVIGVGPGLGTNHVTERALEDLLRSAEVPLVVDADALNLLAKNPDWFDYLPEGSILTPHPKEFSRLFGETEHRFEQLNLLRSKSTEHHVFIVLKGAYTAIAAPGGFVMFNTTGNPGMGTGGTGDVLTGMITGLLAQKYDPFAAARLGVFLHGLAGDIARDELGQESLLATDLLRFMGMAFQQIRK